MKVINTPQPTPAFTPVDITLRIESLEEAEKLYFIFNYSPLIINTLKLSKEAGEIREQLLRLTGYSNLAERYNEFNGLMRKHVV